MVRGGGGRASGELSMGSPPGSVRVLKFLTAFGLGGTESQLLGLCRALDRGWLDLRAACFRREGHHLDELDALGIPLTEYRINRLYNARALRQQLRFARDLRRDPVDVVHVYGFYPIVFAMPAARLARAPVLVVSIRDTGDHLRPAQRATQRLACRLAHAILVNADAVKEHLIGEGYPAERIAVIRNGIDVDRYAGVVRDPHMRRALAVPEEAPVLAVFSRLVPMKGIEYFLDAAAMLARDVPAARFLVVGSGPGSEGSDPIRRELEERAAQLGIAERVRFTGLRLDIPELLSEVDVSVQPSLSEGLSNSVLEAMAAGVPVVATAVGGNPEAVEHERTGLLVPPQDARALADAMRALVLSSDTARRLAAAAQRSVVERFSMETVARQTEDFYLRTLRHSHAKAAPRAAAAARLARSRR